jgi:hypothetical protein
MYNYYINEKKIKENYKKKILEEKEKLIEEKRKSKI